MAEKDEFNIDLKNIAEEVALLRDALSTIGETIGERINEKLEETEGLVKRIYKATSREVNRSFLDISRPEIIFNEDAPGSASDGSLLTLIPIPMLIKKTRSASASSSESIPEILRSPTRISLGHFTMASIRSISRITRASVNEAKKLTLKLDCTGIGGRSTVVK